MAKVAFVAAAVAGFVFLGHEVEVSASTGPRVPQQPEVFVVGANGQKLRQLTFGPAPHNFLLWMHGGAAVADVAYPGDKVWVESRRVSGGGRRVLSARVFSPSGDPAVAFSPASGLTAVERFDESTWKDMLTVVGKPGTRHMVIDRFPANSLPTAPAWSPDGRLIAYSPPNGPLVVVVAPDGHGRRVLVHGRVGNSPVVFSPDGRSILFSRSGGNRAGLYTVPTRGGPVHRIARGDFPLDTSSLSPNGRAIAWTGYRNGGRFPHLFVMNIRTRHIRTLASSVQLLAPAWSPDGKQIAFATWLTPPVPPPKNGYAAVEAIRPDGTRARVLVRAASSETLNLAWSANGNQIAFTLHPTPTSN